MSGQAVIDSLAFACNGEHLAGVLQVSTLARLQDNLYDSQGALEYTLQGGYDAKDRPKLHVAVKGGIHLRCQRCLGSLDHAIDTASDVLVLTGKMDVPAMLTIAGADELEDLDGIPASPQTEVQALVEDEVLLALPIAPRHAEGECEAAHAGDIKRESPFAALAQLKRN